MNKSQTSPLSDSESLRLFMGMFAHELRSQLSGIVSTCRYALHTGQDHAEYFQLIAASVERSIHVLDNLLRVIQAHAGALVIPLRSDSFLLLQLLGELLPSFDAESLFQGKRFAIQTDPALKQQAITTDKLLLTQILYNLITNALKHGYRGHSIRIRCSTTDGNLQIAVENTGETIPAEALRRLFDPFFQADHGRAGAGLGLYISRLYAEQLGGNIQVMSAEKTTRFILSLPAEDGKTITAP